MSDAARRRLLLATYLVSGIPGLMAQMAWARVFAAGLGHEVSSLLGVTTAFLIGLAGGARAGDRMLARSQRPGLGYACFEGFSALWILAGIPFLELLNHGALSVSAAAGSAGVTWLVAFLVPILVIGPAALAMGATFPAMERAVRLGDAPPRQVALLYALNTAGAVVGVVWAVLGWMPAHGFRATLGVAAILQLICAGLGGWAVRSVGTGAATPSAPRVNEPQASAPAARAGMRWVWWLTGVLSMAYQWTVVRILAQVLENTIETFAWCLACYLVGTTGGAALERALERRRRSLSAPGAAVPLLLLGVLVVAQAALLGSLTVLHAAVETAVGVRGAEWLVALVAFGLPAVGMGLVFSRLVQAARGATGGVGTATAWNTLGAAMGGPAVMLWGLPLLGSRVSLGVIAAAYVGLGLLTGGRGAWRLRTAWAGVALAGGGLVFSWLRPSSGVPGASVTHSVEGPLATVTVERTADGHRTLRVNQRFQQGGTASAVAARRQGHLPLLLHPEPKRALYLGVGTGLSLGVVRSHAGLEAVGVELLPEVIAVLPAFEPENGSPQSAGPIRIVAGDARRYLRSTRERFDVVIADLFHPAQDGAGFLYTREHFEAMRRVLQPGGLACQWLPLHQLDLPVFRDIVRTFNDVFPHRSLWLLRFNVEAPVVGLVGSDGPLALDPVRLGQRLESGSLARDLAPLALNQPLRVLGCLVADDASLTASGGTGPVATDDWPLVLFRAPRLVYRDRHAAGDRPSDRLLALLSESRADLGAVVPSAAGAGMVDRWVAFTRARNAHLRGLAEEEARRMDRAVEHYLESVAASPDYTAGYAQAVLVASAYRQERGDWARGLLQKLVELRPDQSLARELLQRWEARDAGRGGTP